MVVLLDTNVVLNYITGRNDSNAEASIKIMELCASETIEGYLSFHSVSIIWYVLRKLHDDERRAWLKNVCELLTVTGASHEEVVAAIENEKFVDFEDCLQDKCAKEVHAEYIVTCNIADYAQSETPAITPTELIQRITNR